MNNDELMHIVNRLMFALEKLLIAYVKDAYLTDEEAINLAYAMLQKTKEELSHD